MFDLYYLLKRAVDHVDEDAQDVIYIHPDTGKAKYVFMSFEKYQELLGGDPGHKDEFPHKHEYGSAKTEVSQDRAEHFRSFLSAFYEYMDTKKMFLITGTPSATTVENRMEQTLAAFEAYLDTYIRHEV